MNDAQLLAATARGDADAFAMFYRRHLDVVIAFAVRATGDRELAADLAAKVFAVALASYGRYEPRHPTAAPWLIGIAHNKLRESRRRGRVQDAVRRRLQIAPLALLDDDLERVDELAAAGDGRVLVAGTEPCGAPTCRTVTNTGWLVGDSLSMSFNGAIAARMVAPPFAERFLVTARRRVVAVLQGGRLAGVAFGTSRTAIVRQLTRLLGRPAISYGRGGSCAVPDIVEWSHPPATTLTVFFGHGRFAGYAYGEQPGANGVPPQHGVRLATPRGLTIGDTLTTAARLYGATFRQSAAQGGSWSGRERGGRVKGFDVQPPGRTYRLVATIDAGNVGCPAVSP